MTGWLAMVDTAKERVSWESEAIPMAAALDSRGPDGRFRMTFTHGVMAAAFLDSGDPGCLPPLATDPASGRAVVGDLRLDNRAHLCATLNTEGIAPPVDAGDAGLILAAYDRWADRCPDLLAGDFGWALWDPARQSLMAVRDPFGVKPVYWTVINTILIVSNTIAAICSHPAVLPIPDDDTIADYLIAGHNRRPEATYFKQIRSLPPGHRFIARPGGDPVIDRYWRTSRLIATGSRRPSDPTQAFRDAMTCAVADRWPKGPLGVLMSGGLDSTCVAATAAALGRNDSNRGPVTAVTFGYGYQVADPEPAAAALAADALGLHHLCVLVDQPNHSATDLRRPGFPTAPGGWADALDRMHGPALPGAMPKMVLTGHGGDPAFDTTPDSLAALLRWLVLHGGGWQMIHARSILGRWPALGIRSALRRRMSIDRWSRRPPYPPYAAPEFETATCLRDRYRQWHAPTAKSGDLWTRSAIASLADPVWPHLFESWDPGASGRCLVFRHPFFDIRVLKTILALPVLPWRADKRLIRRAMADRLPPAIVHRPKTALTGLPAVEQTLPPPTAMEAMVAGAPELNRYLDVPAFLALIAQRHRLWPEEISLITRPLALAQWLVDLSGWAPPCKETTHETRFIRQCPETLRQSAVA